MILILSTPTDLDTEKVIEWLQHHQAPFFRLNDEDMMMGITEFYYSPELPEQAYFEQGGKRLYIKDIKSVWFRKFGFLTSYEKYTGKNSDFYKYTVSEFSAIRTLVFDLLADKKWLYRKGIVPSKPKVLEIARNYGLTIPASLITSKKQVLDHFFQQHRSLITKTVGEGKQVKQEEKNFPFMTLSIDAVDQLPNKFAPSYVQQKVIKEYEIRTFFVADKIFSMAIFSQNDKKTEVDFRVFDPDKPIRFVPYQLPAELEDTIRRFMNEGLGLNTGSLDFMKSIDGDYVFLEVNPAGQFGMTSYPCNYCLHEEVALTLIDL